MKMLIAHVPPDRARGATPLAVQGPIEIARDRPVVARFRMPEQRQPLHAWSASTSPLT
jgi:hypothetical protein